jgi:hypothetical protein
VSSPLRDPEVHLLSNSAMIALKLMQRHWHLLRRWMSILTGRVRWAAGLVEE